MDSNTCNTLQSLSVAGASRVQVGNNYNTTHNYNGESDQDDTKKLLESLRSTDPRHDKKNIEQTNNHLLREAYVWILQNPEFLSWRDKNHDSQLLWIRGDPGKGKTMLLCGIIDELRPSTRLENSESHISLSYFFCQATNSALNNATAVIRGLIYLLVVQQPCLLSHLRANIHWDSRVAIEELFRKIVADPALKEAYLIVDALDECREDLEFLLQMLSTPIPHIRWIVSSRNRVEIEEALEQSSSRLALSLELNEQSVSQAVRVFIDHRTRDLTKKKKLKNEVVQRVHRHLTQHANDTFLWVGLVCQHLGRCKSWEISRQLRQLPEGLNELYARMMEQIHTSDSCDSYIRLLAIVSTVFRPLTISELMAMEPLDVDEESICDFIRECGSFLTTRDTTILFVHQSAKDFLLEKSSELLFQSGLAQHHYALFQRSIDVLVVLRKDMYDLKYPGVSLDEAIRNRPKPDPIDGLVYALVFWVDHLREATEVSSKDNAELQKTFAKTVYGFLCDKFLFWLEALGLCHNPSIAGKALMSVKKLLAHDLSETSLLQLIEDALRFLHLLGPIIETHPLQIYTSGLLFSPQKSLIRNLSKESAPSFVKRGPKVDENWSPILGVFEASSDSEIQTMVFSSMDDMVVMTTYDSQFLMWNANDGYIHKDSRYNHAKWLTPSPDLQLLAFITTHNPTDARQSWQDTLVVCKLNSGNTLWTVKLDGRYVEAMEFAPDSQWLAVCYSDNLHLYTRGGELCQSWTLVSENKSDEFYDLSYSSKSDLLLCFERLSERGIGVFDMRTGIRYKFPGLFATGSFHADDNDERDNSDKGEFAKDIRVKTIRNAKFVSNASLVMVLDYDGGVFLWDFSNMRCKKWFWDGNYIDCFAYSHAEVWMVITSGDEMFLVNRDHGVILYRFYLPDHIGDFKEIQVSYDDKKIAVRSYSTAWLLDVQTGQVDRSKKRESYILDDGVTIVSHDYVTTIEIENSITEVTSTLDIRNTVNGRVQRMTISPDGQLFAYTYWSPERRHLTPIHIWDLKKESLRFRVEVPEYVEDMAISPIVTDEDQWLAVCTPSKLILWHVNTTQFHLSITSPDKLERSCDKAFFRGTWMGVIWNSRRHKNLFVRYDINTGQQLSQMDILTVYNRRDTPLSPNGKWLLSYRGQYGQLLLSDIEAGVHYTMINIFNKDLSFIGDSALWTETGVLHFDCILDNLVNKSETGKRHILEIDRQVAQELPVITPSIHGYGYSTNREWITFDGRPLIWLPQQYRLKYIYSSRSTISVGYHHIMAKYAGGIYCIFFNNDAVDILRRAIGHLSI
ncbi:unnamed protein product [Fusarium graminearum]|uniref:NACHT domain-containing protein n=1 Tax=Gibberella zeae TaxID=5518 RepID=A0A4E9D5N8_GIBZA|nr:unnamed protein product [Fusarium graminearum]